MATDRTKDIIIFESFSFQNDCRLGEGRSVSHHLVDVVCDVDGISSDFLFYGVSNGNGQSGVNVDSDGHHDQLPLFGAVHPEHSERV